MTALVTSDSEADPMSSSAKGPIGLWTSIHFSAWLGLLGFACVSRGFLLGFFGFPLISSCFIWLPWVCVDFLGVPCGFLAINFTPTSDLNGNSSDLDLSSELFFGGTLHFDRFDSVQRESTTNTTTIVRGTRFWWVLKGSHKENNTLEGPILKGHAQSRNDGAG